MTNDPAITHDQPVTGNDPQRVLGVRDTAHPYYATPGCFYSLECHNQVDSWSEFMDAMGEADLDMNFLYRWDWRPNDPEDFEDDEVPDYEVLQLYFIQQRKAKPVSFYVKVQPGDEPAVRAYLKVRADWVARTWEPLLPVLHEPDDALVERVARALTVMALGDDEDDPVERNWRTFVPDAKAALAALTGDSA